MLNQLPNRMSGYRSFCTRLCGIQSVQHFKHSGAMPSFMKDGSADLTGNANRLSHGLKGMGLVHPIKT